LALRSQGTVFTLVALLAWQTQFALLTRWSWVAFLTWQTWLPITHHRQAFCHLGRELGQSRLDGHIAGRLQFQDLDSKFSCGSRELRNSQLALASEVVFLRRKHITNDVMPNVNRNVARP
jgi:DNA segregation ATPase FtsK/SpoIIIE-like protein